MQVKITPNDKGSPVGKLADAELHFDDGPLADALTAVNEDDWQIAADIKDLDAGAQRAALIDSGYVMPHWPKPWGRDAGAVEELAASGRAECRESAPGAPPGGNGRKSRLNAKAA